MPIKPLYRDYNFTDAELSQYASNLVSIMTRDSMEFAARGVDGADITALEAKQGDFEDFPTDDEYKYAVSIAVEDKNNIREQMLVSARNVSDRAMLKWGIDSARYKRFGVIGISKMGDKNMLYAARRVYRTGTEYLTDLADEGLTQIMLDDLEALADSFEDKMNALNDSVIERDTKTEERIKLGNELYDLVAKYCEIGKVIWKDVSEAKYNDYVLYPAEHQGLSKPQNLAAEYVGGSPPVIHLSWDAVIDAASYDVYVSIREIGAPSGNYNLLDNFTDIFADVPPVNNKRNYYKIKAKNAEDTSDYSDEVFVDVTDS